MAVYTVFCVNMAILKLPPKNKPQTKLKPDSLHQIKRNQPGVVVLACNLSTWEAEAKDCEFKARRGYKARPCLRTRPSPPEAEAAVTWGQLSEDSLTFFTEPGCSLFMSLKASTRGPFTGHTRDTPHGHAGTQHICGKNRHREGQGGMWGDTGDTEGGGTRRDTLTRTG
jgi:hypothetical protein